MPRGVLYVLRNALIVTMSGQLNVDVGVVIADVYIEVEGVDFDPHRGVVVLELDQEALSKALAAAQDSNTDIR